MEKIDYSDSNGPTMYAYIPLQDLLQLQQLTHLGRERCAPSIHDTSMLNISGAVKDDTPFQILARDQGENVCSY